MDIRSASTCRTLAVLLAAMVASCALISVWAEDSDAVAVDGGTFGDLTWEIDDENNLSISGNGAMDFTDSGGVAPWESHKDSIVNIIIYEGVTTIAANAFSDCPNLETIIIPESVDSIDADAFGDLVFYDEDGETELDIDADSLDDSIFKLYLGKLVKYISDYDTDPEPKNNRTMPPIVAVIAGILSSIAIILLAVRY